MNQIRRTDLWVFGITICLGIGIFIWDLSLPLGVAGAMPYVAVILVGLWSRLGYFFPISASVVTVLTLVGYAWSPAGGEPWIVFTNRFRPWL